MNKIILKDRDDRYGSNTICKISNYILGIITNCEIYRYSKMKYKYNLFSSPFIEFCKISNDKNITNIKIYGGIRGNCAYPVTLIKKDLISYFNENLKEKFIKTIDKKFIENKYKLPWNNNNNIICIHIRIDDQSNIKDYDGTKSSNYIKQLIENDKISNYDKTKMGRDIQCPIREDKLEKLLEELKLNYSDKEIHIIYSGDIKRYNKIINKYNIILHSNKDIDYDLYLLINSDILILSKSFFSLIAGFYHKGSQVYAPIWGSFTSLGLNTKYDNSNWKYYI